MSSKLGTNGWIVKSESVGVSVLRWRWCGGQIALVWPWWTETWPRCSWRLRLDRSCLSSSCRSSPSPLRVKGWALLSGCVQQLHVVDASFCCYVFNEQWRNVHCVYIAYCVHFYAVVQCVEPNACAYANILWFCNLTQEESTGDITFYMKGADVAMASIVQYNDWLEEEVRSRTLKRW